MDFGFWTLDIKPKVVAIIGDMHWYALVCTTQTYIDTTYVGRVVVIINLLYTNV